MLDFRFGAIKAATHLPRFVSRSAGVARHELSASGEERLPKTGKPASHP